MARLFAGVKAGHAGTLDPLATGMLPVLLGEATRFAQYGLAADKTYAVDIDLSCQTDTLDSQGNLLQRFAANVTQAQIEAVLATFLGEQEQVPPCFSAIRVHGMRAHRLARGGKDVELPARKVRIDAVHLTCWQTPRLSLQVRCGKGTYIRALARDIGDRLHVGGCVVALRRLSLGPWDEELMVDFDTLCRSPASAVKSLAFWLQHLPRLMLNPPLARRFGLGQRLPLGKGDGPHGQTLAVFCGNMLLGTGVIKAGFGGQPVLHPACVLPSAREMTTL